MLILTNQNLLKTVIYMANSENIDMMTLWYKFKLQNILK